MPSSKFRMIHVVKLSLTEKEFNRCLYHASKCSLGGVSRVRHDRKDRSSFLGEDQVIGQVCTCAATMWLLGRTVGFDYYDMIRCRQNENPTEGDGGDDIPPLRIDVKGSKVRNTSKPVSTFRLPVRPREFHDGFIYIGALSNPPHVVLTGWGDSDFIRKFTIEDSGIFDGAHAPKVLDLQEMRDLPGHLRSISREYWKLESSS